MKLFWINIESNYSSSRSVLVKAETIEDARRKAEEFHKSEINYSEMPELNEFCKDKDLGDVNSFDCAVIDYFE